MRVCSFDSRSQAVPDKGIKVTAVDLENGDTGEREIQPGDYLLLPVEPMYLDSIQRYGNGTVVLTLKRRS